MTEIHFDSLPQAIIGEKVPNPLEISNIHKAFNLLNAKTKAGISADDIVATHHYVAFTPTNEYELASVESLDEEEIVIHYFPTDYEVSDGILVPDERFSKNGYSYIWAYIPIMFQNISKKLIPVLFKILLTQPGLQRVVIM